MATMKDLVDLVSANDISLNRKIGFEMFGREVDEESEVVVSSKYDSRGGNYHKVLTIRIANKHLEQLVQRRVDEIFARLARVAVSEPKVEKD